MTGTVHWVAMCAKVQYVDQRSVEEAISKLDRARFGHSVLRVERHFKAASAAASTSHSQAPAPAPAATQAASAAGARSTARPAPAAPPAAQHTVAQAQAQANAQAQARAAAETEAARRQEQQRQQQQQQQQHQAQQQQQQHQTPDDDALGLREVELDYNTTATQATGPAYESSSSFGTGFQHATGTQYSQGLASYPTVSSFGNGFGLGATSAGTGAGAGTGGNTSNGGTYMAMPMLDLYSQLLGGPADSSLLTESSASSLQAAAPSTAAPAGRGLLGASGGARLGLGGVRSGSRGSMRDNLLGLVAQFDKLHEMLCCPITQVCGLEGDFALTACPEP